MIGTVRLLAGTIGPREATSPAFRTAALAGERTLRGLGYAVRRQAFRVPRGTSWGVPVPAGTSLNVVATPPRFDRTKPHLVVGAHLDTVPQAPGAEDNASGVAAVLEVARLAAARPPAVPTVFVLFGAEEPRGPGDALHHFGSRAYVDVMGRAERAALVGMLSLDRVGVGDRVPVCTGGLGSPAFAERVARTARAAGVPVRSCRDNRASDHWSFEKAGLPAARLGSTPYAAYHSSADRPGVVDPDQLARSALVAWRVVRGAAPR
jgi:Zn-dependent M28 family amino/carboxypeptidase